MRLSRPNAPMPVRGRSAAAGSRTRRRVGGGLLVLGSLLTLFVGGLWWLRATADVGRPYPGFYALTVVGPLMAIAGGLAFRRGRGQPSK